MSKNRFFPAVIMVVAWVSLMLGQVSARDWFIYDEDAGVFRVYSENFENFVVVSDRNLWAEEVGENWYIYQWWNNHWFSNEIELTQELAIRNNKFNDAWYNLWNKFIIKTNGDYWSYWLHYDWLWWWMDDGGENMWWMNLIKWNELMNVDQSYDVYDVDIFRQWPCPKWFHVPSYWDWQELREYLNINGKGFEDLMFVGGSEYRDMNGWELRNGEYMFWTSSPVRGSDKAIAISNDGEWIDVSRSMWIQIRCFQNKRDALVWVKATWSDVVFYDTKEPSIVKLDSLGNKNLVLLNGVDTTEFRQAIKLADFVKWNNQWYLYLRACSSWEDSLNAADLKLKGLNNTDLRIECDLETKAVNFNPWSYSILNIYSIWNIYVNQNIRTSCTQFGVGDDDRIEVKVSWDFVKDFATNKSLSTSILSDFIYAPTVDKNWNVLWNYIYVSSHIFNKWVDWDVFIVDDDDLILWWTGVIWSAERLDKGNDALDCSIIEWPATLDPKCEVLESSLISDWTQLWLIHSCGSIWCENGNYWWTLGSNYQTIEAPFKYKNVFKITGTWGTYYLTSWDERTIKVSLKQKQNSTCYARNDWTSSTYAQIKFKKIISPYKAWYLSGDYGWVRYSQYNLWKVLQSWGQDEWFRFYVSNVQTIKTWNMSWWALGKVNYVINFNQEVASEYYDINWNSTVGDYQKDINIKKSTSDNEENPDAYKSRFPSY